MDRLAARTPLCGAKENVVFLGPPRTDKTALATFPVTCRLRNPILQVRPPPVRAYLDGAHLELALRPLGRDAPQRGHGRHPSGASAPPPPDRQHPPQQIPDAASAAAPVMPERDDTRYGPQARLRSPCILCGAGPKVSDVFNNQKYKVFDGHRHPRTRDPLGLPHCLTRAKQPSRTVPRSTEATRTARPPC